MWRPRGVTPGKDCIQNNSINIQSWLKLKCWKIQSVSRKKINVLVWTDKVSWTILDDWQYKVCEGWASFGKLWHLVRPKKNLKIDLKNNHEHPAGGGATMQTSPCRVFKIPNPCSPSWHSPDKVHGVRTRAVYKSNTVCIQNIIGPSNFGGTSSVGESPGQWLK